MHGSGRRWPCVTSAPASPPALTSASTSASVSASVSALVAASTYGFTVVSWSKQFLLYDAASFRPSGCLKKGPNVGCRHIKYAVPQLLNRPPAH